ncbi:protein SSUH2 homolog [Elgaria multicarinata webbii]|uniref:protein SSUH2 homolog n=1 Tax=Elgaria multicarinata webbii TaxID=159646 RepID=UPI002FCD19C0
MEKELLIGDESHTSYGTDHLHAPRVAQDASSDSSPFEGASAPPYELLDNRPIDEEEDSGKEVLCGSSDQLPHEEHEGLHSHLTERNILSVSEYDVKEALLRFAASKCCYRTAPAKGMNLQKLTPLNTYRYRLETFTETRETYSASGIYNGGFVDSPAVAPPPAPWEIMVDPPPLFTDCEMHLPIPHSYSVENCPNCKGRGAIMCQSCKGAGKKKCSACDGTGTNTQEDYNVCSWCAGTGDNRCSSCRSNGWLKCRRCIGSGILLFHTELTITWKNNVLERIADIDSGLPNHHFKDVAGKEILSDEHFSVYPIVDFPEPSIDDYSRACIEQHKIQFASGSLHRILKQKQAIELLPVTKAEYEWKGKLYSFYVFGNENQVYTKDYPGKCCCSLM